MSKWNLFWEYKDHSVSINQSMCYTTLIQRSHIIISIDAENANEKNSTSIHDKKQSQQSGHRRNTPQHSKGHI